MLSDFHTNVSQEVKHQAHVGRGGSRRFARTPLLEILYTEILSALPLESGPLVVSLLLRITVVQASLVAAMRVEDQSRAHARKLFA